MLLRIHEQRFLGYTGECTCDVGYEGLICNNVQPLVPATLTLELVFEAALSDSDQALLLDTTCDFINSHLATDSTCTLRQSGRALLSVRFEDEI